MKITIIQGFSEGFYEEDMTHVYDGHLTTEQVEAIAYQFGNIGDGGYARMRVEPFLDHAWNISYYKTPISEPEQLGGDESEIDIFGVDRHGEVEGDEDKGDITYTVVHDETLQPPMSSPTAIGSQI